MQRKRAAIYRNAARSIERGSDQYSCVAILNANGDEKMAGTFVDTFAYGLVNNGKWATAESRLQIVGFARTARAENLDEDDLRVLALCFMAEITERP